MRKPKPIDHRQQLMGAFEFTEDDLWVNRQGKFSAQRERRGVVTPSPRWKTPAMVLTWLVINLILIWVFTTEGLPTQNWRGVISAFVILGVVSALVVIVEFRTRFKPLEYDLMQRGEIIERACGKLYRRQMGRFGTEYAIVLRKREFPVTWRQFAAVKPGGRYCAYYLHRSKRILSIEWLDDSPFDPNLPYSDEDDDNFGVVDEKPKRDDAPPIIGDDGELRQDAR